MNEFFIIVEVGMLLLFNRTKLACFSCIGASKYDLRCLKSFFEAPCGYLGGFKRVEMKKYGRTEL